MQQGGALTSMTETFPRGRLRSALWLGIAELWIWLWPAWR
jgi:hypothetical protein